MENTTNLKLPLLIPNQSQKEITHNEALIIIDNILQNGVIDKDLTTPPTEPNNNDIYIVGNNATGDWENKDKQIAFYDNGWRFIEPREGFIFWVNDEDKLYTYNGTNWNETVAGSGGGGGDINELNDLTDVSITSASNFDVLQHNGTSFTNTKSLQQLSMVGINTEADTTNKLSLKSDAVLFDKETSDIQIKVNKATSTDAASYLFQTGYSGRAEFGLTGSDDFTLKVSNDGTSWNESFKVNNTNGNIDFKKKVTVNSISLSKFAMPSDNVISVSIGATGSIYTAPADGYLIIFTISEIQNQRVELNNLSKFCTTSFANEINQVVACTCPCKTGDQIQYGYNHTPTTMLFVYAYGEQNN